MLALGPTRPGSADSRISPATWPVMVRCLPSSGTSGRQQADPPPDHESWRCDDWNLLEAFDPRGVVWRPYCQENYIRPLEPLLVRHRKETLPATEGQNRRR